MVEIQKDIAGLTMAMILLITAGGILKIIKILIDGQLDGVSVKESLQKSKRILFAMILASCIASVVAIISRYYQ